MKTAWDLICEWKYAQAEKARREHDAAEAASKALTLDAKLRNVLREHGPVTYGAELFRAPATPDAPVIQETCTSAMSIDIGEGVAKS